LGNADQFAFYRVAMHADSDDATPSVVWIFCADHKALAHHRVDQAGDGRSVLDRNICQCAGGLGALLPKHQQNGPFFRTDRATRRTKQRAQFPL
jgi:hypothetical protein